MASRPELAARWATVVLLAAAPLGATPVPSLVAQARAEYRAGDQFAALADARKALAASPGDWAALEFNAQLVRDAEGPVAALPLFERALKAAPNNVELLGEYAATLADAGRAADTVRIAQRMGELDPGNRRAAFLQAVAAARRGDDDRARRLLGQVDDDAAPAAILLAGVLELRSGSAAAAVDRFDALARRQPDNATAQQLLAKALLANGEANEVVARLRPLAERGDASPYLLTLVGRAYEELGDRTSAGRYLDRAARPLPNGAWAMPISEHGEGARDAAATVAQLRELAAHGDIGGARSLAEQLTARYPGSADVARVAGDAALLAGQPAQALASYRRAAAVRSDFALAQRIATAERWLGHGNEAAVLLERRAAANPLERSAALALAQAQVEHGDGARAASWLERAEGADGQDPRLLGALAQVRLQRGDAPGAIAAASSAHALQRSNGAVAQVLAQALAAQGRPEEADVMFAKARELAAPAELAAR